MKKLMIERSKCGGCGVCQALCSLKRAGEVRPGESAIRVERYAGADGLNVVYCQHCADPVCVTACLKGVVDRGADGAVTRREEGCFACGACEVMCPFGAPVYDSVRDVYVTCDLCGGDPLCVKVCPTGALAYLEEAEISRRFREGHARERFGGNR